MKKKLISSIIVGTGILLGVTNIASASVLYGTSGNGGTLSTLYSIDTTTGITTSIGNVGYAVNGLESYNGILYGTTSTNDPVFQGLIAIDTATGVGSTIGTGWGDGQTIVEMAIDSAGNAFSWTESTDDLYSVNLGLGTGSVVGDTGLGGFSFGHGIAFDLSDNLNIFNGGGDVYDINTATGIGALIGNTGTGDASHHGDTDIMTGLYWGLQNSPGAGGSTAINIIDFATQSVTGTLGLDRGIHTLAFDSDVASVPAPAAFWLVCSGFIGLIGVRKKSKKYA